MSFLKEFRDFAVKGNVVDMAVGIIIGGAFGKIVSSMVNDVIMPPIGKLMNNTNFGDLFIALDGKDYDSLATAKTAGAPYIAYGSFIQHMIDFTILAFAIFLMVKGINRLKKKEEAAPAAPPAQEVLLGEIRDLLKKRA